VYAYINYIRLHTPPPPYLISFLLYLIPKSKKYDDDGSIAQEIKLTSLLYNRMTNAIISITNTTGKKYRLSLRASI
jgi:hypothetical protein